MTLIYRIKRLIKADAHALVDGLEEPKWILNQAIRDMETELQNQKSLFEDYKNKAEQLHKKIESLSMCLAQNEKDIDLAIDEKREDIAKHLIKKGFIYKKNLFLHQDQKELLSKDLDRLEVELKEKEKAYDEITARAEHVTFDSGKKDVFDEAKTLVAKDISLDHEVEIEFLRRVKRNKKACRVVATEKTGGSHEK
ncbi:MAG: PspA/IM30 family protein [bacterium]|nr:PspA/IM30 family protein [bacterium]